MLSLVIGDEVEFVVYAFAIDVDLAEHLLLALSIDQGHRVPFVISDRGPVS